MDCKEINRVSKNQKVKDYIDFILQDCEKKEFTVADMKDLANLIVEKIDKAIISSDERTKFKI